MNKVRHTNNISSCSLTECLVYCSEHLLGEGLEDIVLDSVQLGPHLSSHLSQRQRLCGVEQTAKEPVPQVALGSE